MSWTYLNTKFVVSWDMVSKLNGQCIEPFATGLHGGIRFGLGKLRGRTDVSITMVHEIMEYLMDENFQTYSYLPRPKKISHLVAQPKIPRGRLYGHLSGTKFYEFMDLYYSWIIPFLRSRRARYKGVLQSDFSVAFSVRQLTAFFNILPIDIDLPSFASASLQFYFKIADKLLFYHTKRGKRNDQHILPTKKWAELIYSAYGLPILSRSSARLNARTTVESLPFQNELELEFEPDVDSEDWAGVGEMTEEEEQLALALDYSNFYYTK
jgi:hypothetical protein